jgi:hypothetical protein
MCPCWPTRRQRSTTPRRLAPIWHPAVVYRVLDDGIEITNEAGTARVRLRGGGRPWFDSLLDFTLELHDDGMSAVSGVRTLDGDGLAVWLLALSESFSGWPDTRSWASLEHDARIDAVHDGRGHVTLRFVVRGGVGYQPDAWEAALSVTVDAGEDMRNLAREVERLLS